MKKHLLTYLALLPLLLFSQQTYTWNTVSGDWQNPISWLPQRNTPSPDDIIEFSGNATVTAMPAAETIGRFRTHNNAIVSISGNASVLSIGHIGVEGPAFVVEAGSALQISGDSPIHFDILDGHTGVVGGNISFAGGAHRLTAVSSGRLVFSNGSEFLTQTGFSGNAFGTTNLLSVVFEAGAVYISMAGATPFGAPSPDAVTVFESGSTYVHRTNTPVPALAGRTYGNLVIDGNVNFAGIGSARNCTILNNLHLTSGFFSFKPNTIATHTGNFVISGNIICEEDTWIDIGNINMTGAVVLTGTDQSVGDGSGSGPITIHNLAKNNGTTTLYRTLNITGNIHLEQGKLVSTTEMPLVLHINAGITSCDHNYSNLSYSNLGCDNSFVEGPIVKLGLNSDFFAFPVGEGNKVRPLLLHAATGDFTVRYIRGDPYLQVSDVMGTGIHHISHLEYWDITSAGAAQVELTYYDPNSGGVTDMEALRAARYNGSNWQEEGVISFTGFPGSNGSVTSHTLSAFGYFSLASSSDYPNNPLPMDGYLFTVQLEGEKATLRWLIEWEHQKVMVEKLVDGLYTTLSGYTNSDNIVYDEKLFKGNNIYRLKIISLSGEVYFSDNKIVRYGGDDQIQIYPNPAQEKISIKLNRASSISELVIVNISGSILKRIRTSNQTNIEIEILDLPPGIYYLKPGQTHFPIGRFIKLN